jgi:hypothetical protein
MQKAWALFVTFGLIVGILLPIHEDFRGVRGDSFPFSWYPMFSRPRPDPEWANYIVGKGPDDLRAYIPSRYFVKGGMNQARRQLDFLVNSRRTAKETCERAAKRVAQSKNEKFAKVKELVVARGYFHMEEYFAMGNHLPVKEKVYVRCRVERDKPRGVVR